MLFSSTVRAFSVQLLSGYAHDCETLGTLLLKLERDERDTIAAWGAGVKTCMQLYIDQQGSGTF